ncbi:MAG TPA: hypothetical protein ENK57_00885 [Polyangiaceae bacterium]|nr:hypothetical protein [Polyangiaceae bacterium]
MATVKSTSNMLAVAAALILSAASHRASAEILCVKVPTANFRSGPGTSHDIVFKADKFFPVKILEKKDGWAKVRDFEKEVAWVATRLLGDRDAVVIKVKKGNLRKEPDMKGELVGHVGYGEAFRVVERKGKWLKIATAEKTLGWIHESLGWGD